MESEAAAVSPAPSDAYEHSRTKVGLLASAGDEDAPGTPEMEAHPPAVYKVEAEPPHVEAPSAERSEEGPGTPRAEHEPVPGEPAPFGLGGGGRDCAVGPMGWFAHAADMVQGHAKAADASGKVAEQAEAARLAAEAHVSDVKESAKQFANESRDKAEKAMNESREKAEKAMNDAKEKTEQALNDAKEKTEQALNEAKQKTEQAMNEAKEKAEAFANDAKEKAEAFANDAREKAEALANGAKEKAAEIWAAVSASAARFEGQVQALIKRGMAALPAPPARTSGEPDDDLLEWKRCRRCQAQFDASAAPQEGTCRYHPARFECGTGEGEAFSRRHLFGAVKCDDACEGRFPCCGARQRLCAATSSGCRSSDTHCSE